jgi:hypothetical protein
MESDKSKPTDMENSVEELPKRDVLQIVPANDWQALCSEWTGDVLEMLSGRVDGWALVEERQPRMSMVVGVTYKCFWDELPEFCRYVHKSVSMKGLEPTPPGLPRRVVERGQGAPYRRRYGHLGVSKVQTRDP